MLSSMPDRDAVDVIRELRRFRDDIDEIMNAVCDETWPSGEEKERLQGLLKSLKSRLKGAAKHKPMNKFEFDYFQPAVRNASANLRVATNSHPIKSNWCFVLSGVRLDITFLLSQLEEQFPGV
jgi:hypothetical protein